MMKPKALSLTQPWASACLPYRSAPPIKTFETRSWATNHRGPLLIHAAKAMQEEARWFADDVRLTRPGSLALTLPRGAIIGMVHVIECHRTEDLIERLTAYEREWGDYSPKRFAFELTRAIAFPEPIPCRGALGIWAVPDEIIALLPPEARGE